MELIIFEKDAYYKMLAEQMIALKQAVKEARMEALRESGNGNDWISLKQAKEILPYRSKAKWQALRDTGKIVFAQMGRKIVYSRVSLQEFINQNKVRF